jgi:hypothetical protein
LAKISPTIVYTVYHFLLLPVLAIQYNNWWPILPFMKAIPPLFLAFAFFHNYKNETKNIHFRNTLYGLLLTTAGFVFVSFYPIERIHIAGIFFLILGRIFFFYNMRNISGFLSIDNWKNFLLVTSTALLFFLFVSTFLIPKASLTFTIAIVTYICVDTLLVTAIYFLWRNKKLHSTGIWAIVILFIFDLTGAFSMFIADLNDRFAITLYFGYLSTYLMYRFMIDLRMAKGFQQSDS